MNISDLLLRWYVGLMNEQFIALLKSWTRSFLAAVLGVVFVSLPDLDLTIGDAFKAGLAAVLPVIIRWLDPSDAAFGRAQQPTIADIDEGD